jgi:cyclic beta-1,2-glucan synthetase
VARSGRWDASFEEAPEGAIREEIFSVERLESYAQTLALEHLHGTSIRAGRGLASRVMENARVLARCYRELSAVVALGRSVPPAAKWLLDNFHLVAGQGKAIKGELPYGYYRELPKLGRGELKGYARVYGLAWNWVAHCDSHFDSETLRRFIAAYQRTQPLSIGELWALSITLRIVLLENLRRQAVHVVANLRATRRADRLADLLLGLGSGAVLDPARVIRRFKGQAFPLAFEARLFKRLKDQDLAVAPVLEWQAERLGRQRTTAIALAREEHQEQLTRDATCANVITSLRDIAFFDWPSFVEKLSLVDGVFQGAFDFQGLNFVTRDRYRHAVEDLARGSRYSQLEIARFVAKNILAARAEGEPADSPLTDAGDYLIGPGRLVLERQIKYAPPLGLKALRGATALGAPLYLGALGLFTVLGLALPMSHALATGLGGPLALGVACLALIPATEMAVALVNHGVMKLWRPYHLAALALKDGIPATLRTMVVMPVILENERGFKDLVEMLEVHYLANADGEIFFSLLTDWPDAAVEAKPGEDQLLGSALAEVAELNRKHGPGPGGLPRFGLYHRRRLYNPVDGVWMGWERKRGKLLEFNRLLRGSKDTSYAPQAGDALKPPSHVRFVITLDQDTHLPRGAALKLVGALAHPLNQPRLNSAGDRVTRGYGILQPRISPILPARKEATLFNRLASGRAGADPYAFAVSEVYQDLFGEGSYTGKGIYDVDAFEACLEGRVPENILLSHDLLEGSFARAGLVSDVEFFEEFFGHYQAAARCKHRWARGDWQLLPWILGFAQGKRSLLGVVARWKMLDNLRRSLLAPSCFLALCAAWFLPLEQAAAWSSFVLASLFLPPLLSVLVSGVMPQRRDYSLRRHWRSLGQELGAGMLKGFFSVALLPADAWLMGDAIFRTLFRLFASRRWLLEWTASAFERREQASSLAQFIVLLKAGPVAGLSLLAWLLLFKPLAWPLALPLALLWLASPVIGRAFSLPKPRRPLAHLKPRQVEGLFQSARRTWHFFEAFVDASVHHLPPDNFQEDPEPALATRTSPTNLGLYLLSCASAHDFGWQTPLQLLDRVEKALDSMEAMDKHQGHFYNWYDLKALKPMEPRFISTVDSGNLAGHLLVARQALLELLKAPILPSSPLRGLKDSLALAQSAAQSGELSRLAGNRLNGLPAALGALSTELLTPAAGAPAFRAQLSRLKPLTESLVDISQSLSQEHGAAVAEELLRWALALQGEQEGFAAYARALLPEAPLGFNPPLDEAASGFLALGLAGSSWEAGAFAGRVQASAGRMQALVDGMHFGFLYDPAKSLFSIGYRVADGVLDAGHYDLLASETRLTSFLAVARGEVKTKHWAQLGRPFAPLGRRTALLSWSGSMFEYLMPLLVMQSPPGSLLYETYGAVVKRQIQFGKERGLPWGVSESACNIRDKDMTYQYSDFGVEGLGIKSGLGRHKVVAPYATVLALMVDPGSAAANLDRLASLGAQGTYGYYDAVDFGAARFPEGKAWVVVRTFMAHHQGMSLIALSNALHDGVMQERFMAVPMLRSAALLLQERSPRDVALSRPTSLAEESWPVSEAGPPVLQRIFNSPHSSLPQTHLLCNGSYSVMLTAAGGGYSRWKDSCVTRFRPDAIREAWGSFLFIRDMRDGDAWSATYLPSRREPASYQALFREDKAEFIRRDGSLESHLEVAVSPEDDVEVRRLTLKNMGFRSLDLELTSYAEVSLSEEAADLAHPAFAKLFVQTEYAAELGALLAHRRARDPKEGEAWAAHLSFAEVGDNGGVHFETERSRFLGRGRDIFDSVMGTENHLFSNTAGAVLDPIFSLRRRLNLEPGGVAHLTFATMAAPSREKVLALASKIRDGDNVERLFHQAWIHAQVQMRHRGIQPEEARLFQTLAGHLLYPDPRLRPPAEMLARNRLGMNGLWGQGISGGLPILLLRIDEASDREILRQALLAWEYWRLKNLAVDLVILNEEPASYAADFQGALEDMASHRHARVSGKKGGSIHVVKACLLSTEELNLLLVAARAILHAGHGSLFEQMERVQPSLSLPPRIGPPAPADCPPLEATALEFHNGLGGFADGGREYRIALEEGQETPAPWINVIANQDFGFQVSESGSGYTWASNSRENKLSAWSNDPVSDPPSEAIYVRDEESGDLFTPTALPIRLRGGRYVARHGQGYSCFESTAQGIQMALTQLVPLADPVKISHLLVKNVSDRTRNLSLTAYVEWVLGTQPQATASSVVTEMLADLGVLTAKNAFNPAFPAAIAFFCVGGLHHAFTADRREFLGRHGSWQSPQGLSPGARLSGRVGAGLDPCGALQSLIELKPGESAEFRVLFGQAQSREHLGLLLADYRSRDLDALLKEVRTFWDGLLGALQVKTPDRAMDIMLNRWLPYQTLSCRIWARTALYQCGGAYGFRDQLQDVMALTLARPEITRAHLLRAAGKGFEEGDVLHWWHPPTGAGVRTRITDDRLWLPYAVAYYAEASGDAAVLDEQVPFLTGPLLEPGEEDRYFVPVAGKESATLYEHCARILDFSLKTGSHGLPLMGGGDWNDGMNKVGAGGKGESIWLAWFLVANLRGFAGMARARGEGGRALKWQEKADSIAAAAESQGWDGDWYRRAFFDDGSALGSAGLAECRIDSIAQSWAVLSHAAQPARAARAMAALEEYLWKRSDRLQVMLTPPFDKADPSPGYIMGYLPGIRENGGQYNHAATWSVAAFAQLGEGGKALELFASLNPAALAGTRAGMQRYKIEPYVMAGDIYSQAPHVGRGGWSWYTGSAAWMVRAGVEFILGLTLHGDSISIDPCIPPHWPGFELQLNVKGVAWKIQVTNPDGVSRGIKELALDGVARPSHGAPRLPVARDGKPHLLKVVMGAAKEDGDPFLWNKTKLREI